MDSTAMLTTDNGSAREGGGLALDLSYVSKMYRGKVHALQGIEMRVKRGEIFGLLGPNGAGKSTLVKILLTVIKPTRADGLVLGQQVGHKPTLARVGYLPEHHRFPEYLTGAQVIDFYGALAQTPREERRRRGAELLDLVGMSAWADKKVRGYSKGMRQRVGIAQALVNNPDLVILDEPTDGVDPVGRRDIRNIVTRMRDEGRTVFLNSHLLSELELVCDRVAIMVQGKVVKQGTIHELTRDKQYYGVTIGADPGKARAVFGEVLQVQPLADPWPRGTVGGALTFGGNEDAVVYTLAGSEMRFWGAGAEVVQPIIDGVRAQGAIITDVRFVRPSLEDLFMEAVTDPNTGAALPPGAARGSANRKGARP